MHENLVDVIGRLNRKLVGMYAYYGINGMFKDYMKSRMRENCTYGSVRGNKTKPFTNLYRNI